MQLVDLHPDPTPKKVLKTKSSTAAEGSRSAGNPGARNLSIVKTCQMGQPLFNYFFCTILTKPEWTKSISSSPWRRPKNASLQPRTGPGNPPRRRRPAPRFARRRSSAHPRAGASLRVRDTHASRKKTGLSISDLIILEKRTIRRTNIVMPNHRQRTHGTAGNAT